MEALGGFEVSFVGFPFDVLRRIVLELVLFCLILVVGGWLHALQILAHLNLTSLVFVASQGKLGVLISTIKQVVSAFLIDGMVDGGSLRVFLLCI